MSRIDDVIAEHCPTGVPHRNVTELADYVRGITYSKSDEQPDGPIGVLRANNITLASNTLNFVNLKRVAGSVRVRENQRLQAGDILLCAGSGSKDHIGKAAYVSNDLSETFGGFMAVLRVRTEMNSRFLFHVLTGATFARYLEGALSTATINNLNARVMSGFRVPVPPLEVQREIVRVLDTFTELEAELEAELEVRRQQYEYYRDMLLQAADGVEYKALGDVGELVRGNGMPKSDFTETGVGAIHYGQIYTYFGTWTTQTLSHVAETTAAKLARVDPGDVIITNTSETLDDVGKAVAWLGNTSIVTGGHATVFRHDLDSKYVSYWFQSPEFREQKRKYATGTKVIDVSAKSLARIRIPVPPLEIQREISAALDSFDTLVNDLSVGLPAELTARRQQYEYYRDRLLTFEETPA